MLVVVADRREKLRDVVVVEAVEGMAPGAADADEALLPQALQLVRGGARRYPGRFNELLHRSLAVEHRPEQAKSARGSEGAHRLCQSLRLG